MRTLVLLLLATTAYADHITTDWQLRQGLPPTGDEFCIHLELPVELTNNLNETRTETGAVDWCFTAGQSPPITNQRMTISGPSFLFEYDVASSSPGNVFHQYGGDGHNYLMTLGWREVDALPDYFTPLIASGEELFGPATATLDLHRSPYQEIGPDRPLRLFERMDAWVGFDFQSTTGAVRRVTSSGSVSSPAAVPEPSAFVMLSIALLGVGVIKRARRSWATIN